MAETAAEFVMTIERLCSELRGCDRKRTVNGVRRTRLVGGRLVDVVDDDDFDGIFGGNKLEAELLMDEGEERGTVGVAQRCGGGLEGDVVDAGDASTIENGEIDAAEFGKLLGEFGDRCIGEDEASVDDAGKGVARIGGRQFARFVWRQPGSTFSNNEFVDRGLLLFAMQLETETSGEEITKH